MLKRILIIVVVLFLLLQFIRPEKNISAAPQTANILNAHPASPELKNILQKACFDCHSNNTKYPWYSNIQPFAWWLNDHITEGKHELNFDEFLSYPAKKQKKKMEETAEMVQENEMPLKSYTWIHKDAVLTAAEKKALIDWARGVEGRIVDREAGKVENEKEE